MLISKNVILRLKILASRFARIQVDSCKTRCETHTNLMARNSQILTNFFCVNWMYPHLIEYYSHNMFCTIQMLIYGETLYDVLGIYSHPTINIGSTSRRSSLPCKSS